MRHNYALISKTHIPCLYGAMAFCGKTIIPSSLRLIGFPLHQPDQTSIEQGNEDRVETIKEWSKSREEKEGMKAVGRGRELERKGDVTSSQQRIRRREGENEQVWEGVCVGVFFFLALQHQHTEATINLLERKKHKTSPQEGEGKYQIRKERVSR